MGILRDSRDFRLLWAGAAVSQLGTYLLVIAVPAHLYASTGSALAPGFALAVQGLPAVLLGPWAGLLADRYSRRTLLAVGNVVAAAGVLLMAAGTTWVYAGLLVESIAAVLLAPAARALIPAVAADRLVEANSVNAFTFGAARLAGPPLGTLLYAQTGLGTIVTVDAATYLLAALAAVALSRRPVAATPRAGEPVGSALAAGLRYVTATPILRGLLATSWAFWMLNAALSALLVPYLVRLLHRPGPDLGWLIGGLGAGYLAGAALSRKVAHLPTRTVLVTAYTAVAAAFLVLFNAPNLVVAALAAAAAGVPGAVAGVTVQTALPRHTPDRVLGRVSAAFYAGDAVALVTGALLATAVAGAGLALVLNLLSLAVAAVAAAGLWLLPAAPVTPASVA
ncbi:MFS transporter [Catellatospora tritici]|uniref:MFS transporter n=1 Tax=Catellatospora tritici TaxID=2851566 RepID=UPI001C2DA489|nr:MFS transporter [Catellatospora tritici]MBV1850846.1 MFS transporter [Catellatospora tritici]MBV1851099.1 MFS transporter [Catellatospora tritici]